MVCYAKICMSCGSLEYRINQSCTERRYGTMSYVTVNDGEYNDEFDVSDNNDDSGDWEDDGDPECSECESTDLLDLENLTKGQFKCLYHLEPELRIKVAREMCMGTFVMPDLIKRKNSKYIGGEKVIQC